MARRWMCEYFNKPIEGYGLKCEAGSEDEAREILRCPECRVSLSDCRGLKLVGDGIVP